MNFKTKYQICWQIQLWFFYFAKDTGEMKLEMQYEKFDRNNRETLAAYGKIFINNNNNKNNTNNNDNDNDNCMFYQP